MQWSDEYEQHFLDTVEQALKLFSDLHHVANLDSRVSALLAVYDLVSRCKLPGHCSGGPYCSRPSSSSGCGSTPKPLFPNAQICRIWHATAQNYIGNRQLLYSYCRNPPGIPGMPHTDYFELMRLDTHFLQPFVL